MEASWITAMKTGALTAVTARYLARPDSRKGEYAAILPHVFRRALQLGLGRKL
jgi:hypothetical protein